MFAQDPHLPGGVTQREIDEHLEGDASCCDCFEKIPPASGSRECTICGDELCERCADLLDEPCCDGCYKRCQDAGYDLYLALRKIDELLRKIECQGSNLVERNNLAWLAIEQVRQAMREVTK